MCDPRGDATAMGKLTESFFIHPEELKEWKKYQARVQKDRQSLYSHNIRSRMM